MGKFKFIETGIEGLVIVEPTVFGDNRGYFMETYKDVYKRQADTVPCAGGPGNLTPQVLQAFGIHIETFNFLEHIVISVHGILKAKKRMQGAANFFVGGEGQQQL